MSARNGVISLSYARSAGTGDQPVPGTVTSRRNSSRHERQAIQRKRQEEEERSRKQKEEQEQIAKILAHKWAEEDRKKGSRRKRGDDKDRPRSDSEEDKEERVPPKQRRRRAASGEGDRLANSFGSSGGPHGVASGTEEDGGGAGEEEASERVAGWVSYERRSVAAEAKEAISQPETLRGSPPAPLGSGEARARRFSEGTSAVASSLPASSSTGATAPPSSSSSSRGAHDPSGGAKATSGKSGSMKVANVFGFGVEEDEEVARKEMELAARSKKSKLTLPTEAKGSRGEGLPVPSATSSARRPLDMCQQLMKMAEWKRSCGGKRLPMPRELEADVAKAMGGLG
mmetsp:Transcript_8288/g.22816  ORF Transcript_8288/g.22816 Transcript_8288/m.22816 type:complete len:343 (+) Transcript_8288:120-1148(+)